MTTDDPTTTTYLLTDVVDSLRLYERFPEAAATAVARHDALVVQMVQRHGGRHLKERGEGDSHLAVFDSAAAAIRTACDLQQALLREPWPTGLRLAVRAAVHSCSVDERQGADYLGLEISRCGHLRDAASGGQTLVSAMARELARAELPPDIRLEPLGQHRLRGMLAPMTIFQLVHPDLPRQFPPIASWSPPPNNLPEPRTPFTGRLAELAQVLALLESSRLVTLTGVGGCGKTRLALQAAAETPYRYPDGIWLVELAAVADPSAVARAVATAIGVEEAPGQPIKDALVDRLADRKVLLVLDNCEHLVDASADLVDRLLRHCRRLRVMTTTTMTLDLPNEVTYHVPPLGLPDHEAGTTPEGLMAADATRLFTDRARQWRPDFPVTSRNAGAIAGLCRRLDGLPLAIELAAAQVDLRSPEEMEQEMASALVQMPARYRATQDRHKTMQAAIQWSYRLLPAAERTALNRCGVFAGPFDLTDAAAVAADDAPADNTMAQLLASLVRRSMLVPDGTADAPRYRMLESLRSFALRALDDEQALATMQRRHATWYRDWLEQVEPRLVGAGQAECLDQVALKLDNVRAALAWLLRNGEVTDGLRAATALYGFWQARGYFSEGREQLERLLAVAEPAVDLALLARAERRAGALAYFQGDLAAAQRHFETALDYARAHDTPEAVAALLSNLSLIAMSRGDRQAAVALLTESLALTKEAGDEVGIAQALANLGRVECQVGDLVAAEEHLGQAVAIHRQASDIGQLSTTLTLLGETLLARGDIPGARAALAEAMKIRRDLGSRPLIAEGSYILANIECLAGNLEAARVLYADALAIGQADDNGYVQTDALAGLARIALETGAIQEAGDLFERSLALAHEQDRPIMTATALHGLGLVAAAQGDRLRARSHFDQALSIRRRGGYRPGVAETLSALAHLACAEGEVDDGEKLAYEALALRVDMGDRHGVVGSVEDLAALAARRGQHAPALRLAAAGAAERRRLELPRLPTEHSCLVPSLEVARRALGPEAAAEAEAAGTAISIEAALLAVERMGAGRHEARS